MALSKNVSLLRALSAEVEILSCDAAKNEFPVLLRPIAERRKVTSVEFCPLLVDAMLTTHPNGFRILFNSNGADPLELRRNYECESREQVMGSRLRFSLAHEIAHTLFYDLSGGIPQIARQFRSGGGRTVMEKLEWNCNRLAAQMLLPTPMLRAALRRMKTVNPQALLELAGRAGVSIAALVRRINDQNNLLVDPYFRGCIVLAKQSGHETTVTAIAKPPQLNIARNLRLMRAGERWQLAASDGTQIHPINLPPLSGAKLTVESPQATSEQCYQIAQVEVARSASTVSSLLTFEEVENF